LLAKSAALAAKKVEGQERDFYSAKLRTAFFYTEQVLPQAIALSHVVAKGAASVIETDAALV
jgi:hypothetical protein